MISSSLTLRVQQQNLQHQANSNAQGVLVAHFELAASRGVGTSECEKVCMTQVAQHALFTANLAYDVTEAAGEHMEVRSAVRVLLQRFRDEIEGVGYPCGALDDDFVQFARQDVGVDPCRGPLDTY